MKIFCVLVCLALAVQARPQVKKPQIAADPAEAFDHSKPQIASDPAEAFIKPTVHGDPIGAIGGKVKPAPVIEVIATPEERTEETTTVVPEVAEPADLKAAVESDPKPILTTGGKDPVPTESKPAAPSKPDSSEEDGSAEEAGRKKRQAPIAVAKGKKSEESSEESAEATEAPTKRQSKQIKKDKSSEESNEEVTTTASVKAASAEVKKEVEEAKPVKKIN